MKIEAANDIIIKPPGGSADNEQPPSPTSLQLVKQVAVARPVRVCRYKGFTYVGNVNNKVHRIDQDGNVTESFIKLPGIPAGIIAHEDRLYILVVGQPHLVHVYDLNGTQLHTWNHEDRCTLPYLSRALTIVNNQLVIADRTGKRFIIYSLTGKTTHSVKCDLIGENEVSLCFSEGDSILVTNYLTKPHLYKFNLTSGAVEWRSDETAEPTVITKLNRKLALVCKDGQSKQTKLSLHDINTG